jgi:hypothetical protein
VNAFTYVHEFEASKHHEGEDESTQTKKLKNTALHLLKFKRPVTCRPFEKKNISPLVFFSSLLPLIV